MQLLIKTLQCQVDLILWVFVNSASLIQLMNKLHKNGFLWQCCRLRKCFFLRCSAMVPSLQMAHSSSSVSSRLIESRTSFTVRPCFRTQFFIHKDQLITHLGGKLRQNLKLHVPIHIIQHLEKKGGLTKIACPNNTTKTSWEKKGGIWNDCSCPLKVMSFTLISISFWLK